MTKKKIISKYSVLVFFFVSLILSLFSFSKSYYIDWMLSIGDFTSIEMGSNVFWGVIFPTLYLFILWNSAKYIDSNLKEISFIKTCFDFSFQTGKKLLILLFIINFVSLLMNGISAPLKLMILDKIIFSFIMILSFLLFTIFITFFTSLIIVKVSQSKLKL